MKSILFLIVVLLTNIIQGITGFAGTVLAMPFSISLIGVDAAKNILCMITIISCLYISIKNYKYILWKELLYIVPIMFLGVLFGEYLYDIYPLDILLIVYSIFIILISLKGLFIKNDLSINNTLLLFILMLSGIIHGMFISGGPLLIIYASKKFKEKDTFRATLSTIWVFLNSYMLISNLIRGLDILSIGKLTLYAVPALTIGLLIGNVLYKKINQNIFMKITYILLLISGLFILV